MPWPPCRDLGALARAKGFCSGSATLEATEMAMPDGGGLG